jgi:tetratricopeptide (TPR) repeat protein
VVKSFEHLSNAQIEQYGTDSFSEPSNAPAMEAHLEDCADCRNRVLEHQRARFALLANDSVKAVPTGGCVSEDELRKLAAGVIAPEQALTMTHHVAQCEHCAPILRAFAEDFSDDLSPEEIKSENEMLAQLKSSSAKWQKHVAGQAQRANRSRASNSLGLTSEPLTPRPGGWSLRWILVPAAVAATALIAFGLWYANHDTPEKVEKLLAQAYTEQRTMEYRWPGAEWGPVRVTRGAGQSHLPRPAAQLEAERILAEHQGNSSSDPKWLTVKAEAELQKGELPAAISDLAAALSRDPGSIRIKLLLAIAYAQQGEISGDRASSEQSLVLLDDFQDSQYANAARFNRGLVLKQLNLQDKSREEFDSLVHEETQPSWRPEDRTRGAKAN